MISKLKTLTPFIITTLSIGLLGCSNLLLLLNLVVQDMKLHSLERRITIVESKND